MSRKIRHRPFSTPNHPTQTSHPLIFADLLRQIARTPNPESLTRFRFPVEKYEQSVDLQYCNRVIVKDSSV